MTLTMGTGPLAAGRTGRFDDGTRVSEHPVYVEQLARRVRGYLGGQVVVDCTGPTLVHVSGRLPQWWFPRSAVDEALLSPTGRTRADKVLGALRTWDVQLDGREAADAAYDIAEPAPGLPSMHDFVAVEFDALDRWLKEDDEVIGHPRDPYHRVDTRRASDHVIVRAGGQVVAETRRPVKVFETGLPVRYYLPVDDVRREHLAPSLTRTVCPYKGIASYWDVCVGGDRLTDAAWTYADPLGEALQTRHHVSFLADGLKVAVTAAGPAPASDGVARPRRKG